MIIFIEGLRHTILRELINLGRVKLLEKYYTKFKEYGYNYDRWSA